MTSSSAVATCPPPPLFDENWDWNENYVLRPSETQPLLFEESMYYHSTNRPGFFALLSAYANSSAKQQRSYRMELLPQVLTLIDPSRDAYISQAEFFKPNRRVVNLWRIGLCYVDIDYYGIDHLRDLSPEQVAGKILTYCDDKRIPFPSCIVSSGRGLYLKWFLTSAIPRKALPRWNALEQVLVDLFSPFGSDPKAKDASRVLRLESTINTKTGKTVGVIYPTNHEPAQYNFEDLCTELFPHSRDELQNRRRQHEERRQGFRAIKSDNKQTDGLHKFSNNQLNWDRLEDLRKLAHLRGGVKPGMRDTFLFLAICFATWTLAPSNLYLEVEALAKEFAPSYGRSQVHGYASSAISRAIEAKSGKLKEFEGHLVDPRYSWKNATLVEWLHMEPSEERQMQTIMSEAESNDRARKRDEKRRRQLGAVDRQTYLAPSEDRRATTRLMSAKGDTPTQIAYALGISTNTVYRYLSSHLD